LLRDAGEPWLLGLSLVNLGGVAERRGAVDEARSLYSEALPHLRACGVPASLSVALMYLALLTERAGDYEAAESLWTDGWRASRDGGDNLNTAGALVGLGRLALRRGEPYEAAAHLAESIRLGRRVGSSWLLPIVLDVLGAAANGLGRAVDAVMLYGTAAAIRAASPIPRPVVYPELCQATMNALRAALGVDAYDSYWRLGYSLPVDEATDRALALAEDLSEPQPDCAGGPAGSQPSPALDGLTEREVEVLRLLAAGLSNREIALCLVLSARTVGHHVEHIYRKTGVHGRAEATAYALRHGLIALAR
jgi:DNA-binding CsgD family transcriptional regulator